MISKFVTREQWMARRPMCEVTLSLSDVKGAAVHYSAAYSDEQTDHTKCAQRVRGIQNYHMSRTPDDPTKPWCDIAYNFLFCRHGYVFEGRGWNRRSAAQGTNEGNGHYIAICFLGSDKDGRDDVTADGRVALSEFIRELAKRRARNSIEVQPHSFFHPTACPGDELRAFVKAKGWEIEGKKPWPFKKAPAKFWKWNAWRLAGKPAPRPTGLPPIGSPVFVSYYAWARLYDAYVKRQS